MGGRRAFWLPAALLACVSAASAKQIQPPLTALRTPSANAVSATVLGLQADPPALSLKVEEMLFGRPRTAFKLLVDQRVLPYMEVGGRYVFVYGDLERDDVKPGVFRQTEDGTLAAFDGAEPAAFRDSSAIRTLLDPAHAAVEGRAQYKVEVMAGLASSDPHLQNLWAGELAYRAEVVEALDATDFTRIAAFVDGPDHHPAARARLLRAAREFTPQFGTGWYQQSARKLVATLPINGDDSLFDTAALAHVAFETVRADAVALPQADLARWLRSRQPALAEHALLKLRAQAPEAELPLVQATLEEHLLPAGTRAFLLDHLRRLRLSQAAN